tara:strand:- start:371 stop:559 length:189 start_codon:yes stop_codon:yes gene_type:complete
MDEKRRNNMTTFDKRLSNLQRAMRAAKDEDMKRIWYIKQLELIDQRKARAYERLQDQARMVH